MAIARTRTLLGLDEWAAILNLDPVHFNQVVIGAPLNNDDQLDPATLCSSPTLQYSYQMANALGREEIARAIKTAEDRMMEYTGFALRPTWSVGERVEVQRPNQTELYGLSGLNQRGQFQAVRTNWGHIIECGLETRTPLGLGASVVYSDTDNDGYFETATIAVATTVTDPREIAVYYPGKNADDMYEVRPIKVTFAGGIATITCRREQLVKDALLMQFEPTAIDGLPSGDANFLSTVDVYRHWTDPSSQCVTMWEQPVCQSCGGSGCVACQGAAGTACLAIRDARLGYVAVQSATYDSTTGAYSLSLWAGGRQPDRVLVNYKHGVQEFRAYDASGLLQNRMIDEWAFAVAYFTCAILDRPICSCQGMQQLFRYWQDDLALNISNSGGESTTRIASRRVNECPFGTARGAVYAWEVVQRLKIGEGVTL